MGHLRQLANTIVQQAEFGPNEHRIKQLIQVFDCLLFYVVLFGFVLGCYLGKVSVINQLIFWFDSFKGIQSTTEALYIGNKKLDIQQLGKKSK